MKIEKRNHITYFFFLKESDDDDDDSDVDVAEDDVASDGFDFSDSEWIINLPLSSGQRKLYDDYLSSASSRKALDSLDAESIAKVCRDDYYQNNVPFIPYNFKICLIFQVLHSLRKICNHPQLLAEEVPDQNDDEKKNNEIVFFPRVADDLLLPKIVANRYDPMKDIDLASLNLVFFTHESTLTAITSDRLRKCCAPKALIEELPMTSSGASEVCLKFNQSKSYDTTLISRIFLFSELFKRFHYQRSSEGSCLPSSILVSNSRRPVANGSKFKNLLPWDSRNLIIPRDGICFPSRVSKCDSQI